MTCIIYLYKHIKVVFNYVFTDVFVDKFEPLIPGPGSATDEMQPQAVPPPGHKAAKRNAKSKVASEGSNNDDLEAIEAVAKTRTKAMVHANLIGFHKILTKDTSRMT